jgi:hypothetical protein
VLKILLRDKHQQEVARRHEQHADRAVGTLLDDYTMDASVKVMRHCWQGWETGSDSGKRMRFSHTPRLSRICGSVHGGNSGN